MFYHQLWPNLNVGSDKGMSVVQFHYTTKQTGYLCLSAFVEANSGIIYI